ncbi:MAG TPA: hypothetical protein VGJ97_05895 [Anaerolineaceae bacterium]|jgi:hypothetical protein
MEPTIAPATPLPPVADAQQLAIIQRKLMLDSRIRTGIGWFFWIAGLSLVNTAAYLLGIKFNFVIGLGLTQVIDGLITGILRQIGSGSEILRVLGVFLDIAIAAVFVLFGYFGRKHYRWVVIVGMVLYLFDAILMLVFRDIVAAGFHLLALWGLWGGWKAIGELAALEEHGGAESIESLRQRMPSIQQGTSRKPFSHKILSVLVAFIIFIGILTILPSLLRSLGY